MLKLFFFLSVIIIATHIIFLSAFTTSYEGCFRDNVHNRDLIESTKLKDKTGMTIEKCADHCFNKLAERYQYMGLQVSSILRVDIIL